MTFNRLFSARRGLVALLLTAALLVFFNGCEKDRNPAAPIPAENAHLVAVAGDATLRLYDLDNGTWVGQPLGLGNVPNDIVTNGDRLYVINSLSNDLHIFRYTGSDVELEHHVDLGIEFNRNPFGEALTGDGRLLVTNLMANNVSVLNLSTLTIDTLWSAGLGPEGVAVTGGRAYVVNSGYNFNDFSISQGSVYAFNLQTGELEDSVRVGFDAQYIAVDAAGRLHVSCAGNYVDRPGGIWVLQPSPLALADSLVFDTYPGPLSISPDGTAYVSAGGWSSIGDEHGSVLRYNASTLAQGEGLATGLGVVGVAAGEDNLVCVACREASSLDVYRADTLAVSVPLEDPPNTIALWSPRAQ